MHGIILIDKPAGITSAEVVRRVKRLVRPSRVGHLGTLDPLATGVLPIMIGEATKLAPFLEGGDKQYAGTIRLGVETDTLDSEGAVIGTKGVPKLNEDRLSEVAARYTGRFVQIPPAFSAIKRAGVPLYKLARKGAEVEPPPREVEVRELRLGQCDDPELLHFEVVCSPGTYVRSLARDIGVALDTLAHLSALRRLRNGRFAIEQAQPLESVLIALESNCFRSAGLVGINAAIPDLPGITLDPALERRLRNGDSSALDMLVPAGADLLGIFSEKGDLIAIARATTRVTAAIERIFNVE